MTTTIVWFRQDLRTSDNPALVEASRRGDVVPVYILSEDVQEYADLGGASRWWLHHSLAALQNALGELVLRRGDPEIVLKQLIAETGANAVYWNRCYEPHAITRDRAIKSTLVDTGIAVKSFNAALLHEPWTVQTGSGGPYKVFTPFWRAIKSKDPGAPIKVPEKPNIVSVTSDKLDDWALLPDKPNWASGWSNTWQPGQEGAAHRLETFVQTQLHYYASQRDKPEANATSLLSPHLHFGEISPRQIWARISFAADANPELAHDADKFLSELAWRDFAYHLLFHFPHLPKQNWKQSFDAFAWRDAPEDLRAWQRGQTGYPMVDAGMRELWETGYMHNRVRMITASFLIKHLRIDWREGQRWFWDTLVDADLANNAASWQWVAGSGADASPFFRIFNPVTQGQKFDPDGSYVRRWCPELKGLPSQYVHAPWEADQDVLKKANIVLGETYPDPIVDHKTARSQALQAYQDIKV